MTHSKPQLGRGHAEEMIATVLKTGSGGKIETRTFPDGRRAVVMVAVVPDSTAGELLARALEAAYLVVRQEIEANG